MDQGLSVSNGRELAQILRSLGVIEGKLELILDKQDIQDDKHEAQEKRIRWLESKINWAIGALAVVTFVITVGVDLVKGFFRS